MHSILAYLQVCWTWKLLFFVFLSQAAGDKKNQEKSLMFTYALVCKIMKMVVQLYNKIKKPGYIHLDICSCNFVPINMS